MATLYNNSTPSKSFVKVWESKILDYYKRAGHPEPNKALLKLIEMQPGRTKEQILGDFIAELNPNPKRKRRANKTSRFPLVEYWETDRSEGKEDLTKEELGALFYGLNRGADLGTIIQWAKANKRTMGSAAFIMNIVIAAFEGKESIRKDGSLVYGHRLEEYTDIAESILGDEFKYTPYYFPQLISEIRRHFIVKS